MSADGTGGPWRLLHADARLSGGTCGFAIVLGPIAEPTLRQTLLHRNLTIFTRPIAGPITVTAIILILLPGLRLLWRRWRAVSAETAGAKRIQSGFSRPYYFCG